MSSRAVTTRLVVAVESEDEVKLVHSMGHLVSGDVRSDGPPVTVRPSDPKRLDDAAIASSPVRATVLLDTTPERLLDRLGFAELARIAELCHRHERPVAFGGSLETPDLPRLLPLRPAFFHLGSEVRDPSGRLDRSRLAAFDALLEPVAPPIPHPRPDRVFIRDFVQEMEIGAYRSEHGQRQRVRFGVEVELAPVRAPRSMADIYSYDRMMDAVRALATRNPEPFVETLAEDLAAEILVDARVQAVTVRVEKLDLGPAAAGVEIRRTRD